MIRNTEYPPVAGTVHIAKCAHPVKGKADRIVGFNTLLIALGIAGVMPPSTSAMLHNGSTVALGLKSMVRLLPEEDVNDAE